MFFIKTKIDFVLNKTLNNLKTLITKSSFTPGFVTQKIESYFLSF